MKECSMIFTADESLMPSDWAYCCSECKRRISRRPDHDISFCPYCGSKIKSWLKWEEEE